MSHDEAHSQHAHSSEGSEQVLTDPVCGMTVDSESTIRHEHAGKTYYFCCEQCRDAFRADPGRYEKSN